ncbi:MAG: class II fumarate hydratase [Chlamydiales bacterium]|nr:class II fumarate hydratase [Chlamydiales bacterium]
MSETRVESDSIGEIEVPNEKLWGAQTHRSIKFFTIGNELVPQEMIPAMAIVKKAAAIVNCRDGRLDKEKEELIIKACDEVISEKHHAHFPLHVWMTGSGTQFNMNVNEVISNRISQMVGTALGSKIPVHPNDHVNMSQSTNDAFPTAMHIATAVTSTKLLLPSITRMSDELEKKAEAWSDIVKIGRTHLQDATPLTLGQEFSGYVFMLKEDLARINSALGDVYRLTIGGTAVGTGINAQPGFDQAVTKEIAAITGLPFVSTPNKFAYQGAHDALVHFSGALKTLAGSLHKIANDIRLLACGPRAGFNELSIPANEPGSSIMPGKVNPTQCEALAMVSLQVIANDLAVTLGGAGGHLEMNVYKPLIIYNIMQSIHLLTDSCNNFTDFLIIGMEANKKQIAQHVERSLMLVTALAPVIGYDKASQVAHHAHQNHQTLREAAIELGCVTADEFDKIVVPEKMVHPYVATKKG